MGDALGPYHAASQSAASVQHEHLTLRRRLTDTQVENQILKQQLFQMSALLDIAVSKLNMMGVTLDTPIDIRTLRVDATQRSSFFDHHSAAQTASSALDNADMASKPDGNQNSHNSNKRFQLRTQLREHTKSVQCCAFAPQEEPLLVTGGLDKRLIVRNFFTGEKRWDIVAHDENISDVAWFEGTQQLLSASYDSTVKLWDCKNAEPTPVYKHSASGFLLCAVPLDKSFVFGCADSRRKTSIVDTRMSKPITWEHDSRVNTMAFDNSNGHLIMGHSSGTISIWDLRKIGVAVSTSSNEKSLRQDADPTPVDSKNESKMGSLANANPPTTTSNSVGSNHQANTATASSTPPLLRPEESMTAPSPSHGGGGIQANNLHCISRIINETSHSSISYLAHFHSRDDTKRLICVSDDNMVRCYRGNLSSSTLKHGVNELYLLRNVLPGVPSRGFTVRCGFWKGKRDKGQVSMLFDDGEKDAEQPVTRRLTECDIAVTTGPNNSAVIFDITDEGGASVMEYLEGHRDRVTAVSIHHTTSRPIIATTSADATVRIWVPTKT